MESAARHAAPFAAPPEQVLTHQRPVSALGWGLAMAGGALGWAALFFWLR